MLYFSYSYLEARSIKRKIIYHAGPTNSGKTYQALQQYFNAATGIYCGPLRMLAVEIFQKTNKKVGSTILVDVPVVRQCSVFKQLR